MKIINLEWKCAFTLFLKTKIETKNGYFYLICILIVLLIIRML